MTLRAATTGHVELVRQSLARPYNVTLPMVMLVGMVPFYIFIAGPHPNRTQHVPAIALDAALPLVPAWSLVYGALYAFLIAVAISVPLGVMLGSSQRLYRSVEFVIDFFRSTPASAKRKDRFNSLFPTTRSNRS